MNMGSTSTASSSAAMASSTSMGGMSMGMSSMSMGDASACKVSMLWNWYTVDACFLSSTWHITSPGMFAGSCIGVILLVMALAFLRRLHRAVDATIAHQLWSARIESVREGKNLESDGSSPASSTTRAIRSSSARKPTVLQQALRAFLHMLEFGVAYFIMLLAMYYNGYIIICILIGAFLGYFLFEWGPMDSNLTVASEQGGATEVTGCCG